MVWLWWILVLVNSLSHCMFVRLDHWEVIFSVNCLSNAFRRCQDTNGPTQPSWHLVKAFVVNCSDVWMQHHRCTQAFRRLPALIWLDTYSLQITMDSWMIVAAMSWILSCQGTDTSSLQPLKSALDGLEGLHPSSLESFNPYSLVDTLESQHF